MSIEKQATDRLVRALTRIMRAEALESWQLRHIAFEELRDYREWRKAEEARTSGSAAG